MSPTAPSLDLVSMGAPAAYVWNYGDRRPRLSKLYEKSKLSQWNAATDIDWDVEVDPGLDAMMEDGQFAGLDYGEAVGEVERYVRASEENRRRFNAEVHAWTISQFMHGEQGALVATAKICAAAHSIDDKYYAAQQVADEARHVEVYQRYLEKVDMDYPIGSFLRSLLHDITSRDEIDMTYLGMQILIEGVALAAFSLGGAMFANPLIARITELVRRDEARHVAFGVLSLQGFYDEMDAVDLRVREEFLVEACAAIRDRFVPVDVFDRMGFDVARAEKGFATSPDAMLFRNLIFSKVVPNLRKLGLLTPRVREEFETLGILQYASYVDSATEAGELDPAESIDDFDEDDLVGRFRASLAGVERIEPEPVLQLLSSVVDQAALREVEPATYRLRVDGADQSDWMIDIDRSGVVYRPGAEGEHRDLELAMDVETWTDIVAGRVTAPAAALDGRVSVDGDLTKVEGLIVLL